MSTIEESIEDLIDTAEGFGRGIVSAKNVERAQLLINSLIAAALADARREGAEAMLAEMNSCYAHDAVWEALQRMIEDGQTKGPASREDALTVARHRDRVRLLAATTGPVPAQAVPDGWRLVKAGALVMVVNALRRDAEEGRPVRGEMADELIAAPEHKA